MGSQSKSTKQPWKYETLLFQQILITLKANPFSRHIPLQHIFFNSKHVLTLTLWPVYIHPAGRFCIHKMVNVGVALVLRHGQCNDRGPIRLFWFYFYTLRSHSNGQRWISRLNHQRPGCIRAFLNALVYGGNHFKIISHPNLNFVPIFILGNYNYNWQVFSSFFVGKSRIVTTFKKAANRVLNNLFME